MDLAAGGPQDTGGDAESEVSNEALYTVGDDSYAGPLDETASRIKDTAAHDKELAAKLALEEYKALGDIPGKWRNIARNAFAAAASGTYKGSAANTSAWVNKYKPASVLRLAESMQKAYEETPAPQPNDAVDSGEVVDLSSRLADWMAKANDDALTPDDTSAIADTLVAYGVTDSTAEARALIKRAPGEALESLDTVVNNLIEATGSPGKANTAVVLNLAKRLREAEYTQEEIEETFAAVPKLAMTADDMVTSLPDDMRAVVESQLNTLIGDNWRNVVDSMPMLAVASAKPSAGTTPKALRSAVHQALGVKRVPWVRIFSTVKTASKFLGEPLPPNTAGITYAGQVILIAENVSPGEEAAIVAHEIGAHVAVERFVDVNTISKFVRDIRDLAENGDEPAALALSRAHESVKAAGVRSGTKAYDAMLARETLAYYVQLTYKLDAKPNLLKHIIAWVADLLRAAGVRVNPKFLDERLSDLVNGLMQKTGDGAFTTLVHGDDTRPETLLFSVASNERKTRDARHQPPKPLEGKILGKAAYHGEANTTLGDAKGAVQGVKTSASSTLTKLDINTSKFDDLIDYVNTYKTAAVRNGDVRSLADAQLLPSAAEFADNMRSREAHIHRMSQPNDKLLKLYNGLSVETRTMVDRLLHDIRYYGVWPFDPSEWHQGFIPASKLEQYVDERAKDPNYNPKKDKKLQNTLKTLRRIEGLLKHAAQQRKEGKPVSPSNVVWRYTQLAKGRSPDGRRLSDKESLEMRKAALLVEQVFKTTYEARVRETSVIQEKYKPVLDRAAQVKQAAQTLSSLLQIAERDPKILKNTAALQNLVDKYPAVAEYLQRAGVVDADNVVVEELQPEVLADLYKAAAREQHKLDKSVAHVKRLVESFVTTADPYIPQVRIGEYFVVAKSAAYSAVERIARLRGVYREHAGADGQVTDPTVYDELAAELSRAAEEAREALNAEGLTDADVEVLEDIIAEAEAIGEDPSAVIDVIAKDNSKESIGIKSKRMRDRLKINADHYALFSTTSASTQASAAKELEFELNAQGNPTKIRVEQYRRASVVEGFRFDYTELAAIEAQIQSQIADKDTQQRLIDAVYGLYLQRLNDMVTVQAKQRYKRVYGFNPSQVMVATSTYLRETAHFEASMLYNHKIDSALVRMEQEAKRSDGALDDEDRAVAAEVVKYLQKHWGVIRNPETPNQIVEAILTGDTFWQLTSNVSYYFLQALQMVVYSAPHIAGIVFDAGGKRAATGVAAAEKNLATAVYTAAKAVMLNSKAFEKRVEAAIKSGEPLTDKDFEALTAPGRVKDAFAKQYSDNPALAKEIVSLLEGLQDRGLLDIGLNSDMGDLDMLATNLQRQGGVKGAAGKGAAAAAELMVTLRAYSQGVEVMTRSSTAVATFISMLEAYKKATGKTTKQALADKAFVAEAKQRARWVVHDTLGDYSKVGRAAFENNRAWWFRIFWQFRHITLDMARMLVKLIRYGYKKTNDLSDADRAMYRRQLGYMLTSIVVLLGAKGLPVAGMALNALWAMGLLCDEASGECERLKHMKQGDAVDYWSKEVFGDTAGEIFSGGLFTALLDVDISARVGMTTLFNIMPFEDDSILDVFKSDQAWYETTSKLMFGAAGGTISGILRGARLMAESEEGSYNYYKALAYASPAGLRNLMYAYLWSDEGVKTKSYTQLLSKEDLDAWDLTAKALGFQPKKVSEAYANHAFYNEFKKALNAEAAAIKREYFYAITTGDKAAARRLERKWLEYLKKRTRVGLAAPRTTLQQYVRAKLRRDRKMLLEERSLLSQ